MGIPIVIVTQYGLPVTLTSNGSGTPMEIATNGYGIPVTVVASGGLPVTGFTALAFTPGAFDGPPLNVTISNANRTATWGATSGGVRSLAYQSTGKYYMEFTYGGAGTPNGGAGFGTSAVSPLNTLVTHVNAFSFQGTAPWNIIAHNVVQTGKALGATVTGDTICAAVDFAAGMFWMRRNAGLWNNTAGADPATNVGGIPFTAGAYAPTVAFGAGGSARDITGNFGASAFTQAVPVGFTPGWAVPDTTAPLITSAATIPWPENAILNHNLTANEAVTWAMVGGADIGKFTLVGSVLTLPAKNFEAPDDADTNKTYLVQVQATDTAGNASSVQFISVNITDADEVVPIILSSNTPPPVAENTAFSHILTANEPVTWAIVGGADQARFTITPAASATEKTTNGNFSLDPVNAAQSTVQNGWQWNRAGGTSSAAWSSSAVVLTHDGTNRVNLISAPLTLVVGQSYTVNFDALSTSNVQVGTTIAAASTGLSGTVFSNNYGTGHTVLSFVATATTMYLLFGKTSAGTVTIDNASISGPDGATLTMPAQDYEAGTSRVVQVRATDLAGNQSAVQTITVTITDIDEGAPTITSSATPSVAENAILTHTLTANETVTWTKTGGADAALFTLAGNTLTLPAQDYEAGTSRVVQVTATDTAGNATNQTITVTITDVDEVIPVITSSNTLSTPEMIVLNHALTANETVTWAKVGGADAAAFTLTGSTLTLPAKDYETEAHSWVVQVRATDTAGNQSAVQTITVSITDVSEGGGTSTWFNPTMTSDVLPAGYIASASTVYNPPTANAYKAFDHKAIADQYPNVWHSADTTYPHWLQYQFPSLSTITGYTIVCSSTVQHKPQNFVFQVSNDGSTWTTVDTVTGATYDVNLEFTKSITSPLSRTYCRLYITATDSGWAAVSQLKLFGYVTGAGTAPTAPVLSWITPTTDNTPSFQMDLDNTVVAGDGWRIQIQATGGAWSTLIVNDSGTITSPEDAANAINANIGTLANATYDARALVTKAGVDSAYSNIVTFTIAAVGGAWTPADLGANLVAWYSADVGVYNDAGTTLATDGQTVRQWNDRSGHNYHLGQTTSGIRPTYQATGFDGYKTVSFSAATMTRLETATDAVALGGTTLSAFAAGRMGTATTVPYGRLISFIAAGDTADYSTVTSAAIVARGGSGAGTPDITSYRVTGLAENTLGIDVSKRFGTIFDGANSTLYVSNVGGSTFGSTGSFGATGTLLVGRELVGSSSWDGPISEIVVTKSALNSTELANLDAYLVSRWFGTPADTTPDAFTFTDVTGATISTVYTSNTITVAGITAASAISITAGGTYSKNGGAYTGTAGTVVNGDTVAVRVTSSGSPSDPVSATLTIGGVNDTYTVTTAAAAGPMPPSAVLSALQYWYKADIGVTLSGSNVTVIADQSGNGRDSAPGSYVSPVFDATGFNSGPAIKFTASDQGLRSNLAASPETAVATFFFVGSFTAGGRVLAFVRDGTSDYGNLGNILAVNYIGSIQSFMSGIGATTAAITAGAPYRVIVVLDGTNLKIYLNGAVAATMAATDVLGPAAWPNRLSIGKNTSDTGGVFTAVEWGMTDVDNTADVAALDAYLATKWGLSTPAWTPADLGANLVAWYSADVGVYNNAGTTLATDGQTVQQWNDRSGHNYHLSQATSGNRPTYQATGFDGHKTVLFSSAALTQMVTATDAVALGGTTVSAFFVGQMGTTTSSPYGRLLSFVAAGETHDYDNAASAAIVARSATATDITSYRTSGLAEQTMGIGVSRKFGAIFDGTNNTLYVSNIGGSAFGSSGSFGATGTFNLGLLTGDTSAWSGPISEIVITKSALSPAELTSLDAYFTSRWF